ncbi:hypothetical protein BWI17_17350 [Betaproteobacteria bacterium GR16-43]|nr:hypothetical protein BWI17_17350 [Betaproteobacteria bacterium GR16-43]
MSLLWRKVLGDARQNGKMLAVIALVLAMGTAGVVAALDAQAILKREIAASFLGAKVPDIALWFERDAPAAQALVAAHEGVAGVEPRRVAFTRIAARDGSWLPMRLTILRDIDAQSVGRIHRHGDAAAAGGSGLWIEQSGAALLAEQVGERLRVRTPSGAIASEPLAGFVHDPSVAPSVQERFVFAFATPEVAARLGQSAEFDQLWVRMVQRGDTANAVLLGEELRDALKAVGKPLLRFEAMPGSHPHAALMNAMLRVLGVLSAIAFICSASLAGYLVSAWMKREVRQVGILKAIGARWHQVALQYVLLLGPLVLVVAAIAVPAGGALGLALVRHYAISLNIDVVDWSAGSVLLAQQLAFTLAIAFASMAWPIVRASRMSVREAIHDAGIASPLTAGSRLAKSLTLPGGLRWTFAARNAMRRPFRLALVLFALAGGGALLLTTHSNYESLMAVIDANLAHQGHDLEVFLPRAVPAAPLEAAVRPVPGVEIAEAWRRARVSVAGEGTSSTTLKLIGLAGYPPGSRLFKLPVLEGRAPAEGAPDEILMTRTVQEPYPQVKLGSDVTLQFRERRVNVRVVGIVEEIGSPVFYAPFAAFDAVTGQGDASTVLRAKTRSDSPEAVASAVDQALLEARLPPVQMVTRAMFRDALDEHFNVVGDVLRMVALAAALAGAIVLGAGTAFNVMERTREIGVLRALGATPRSIAAMLLAEGISIAATGALLSIAISIGLTLAMNGAASRGLLHVAVPLRFSMPGLAILAGGLVLVVLAVWLTLRLSLRRSVRESLAFEG